jgi:RNA polymerase sigma-70 factor (ECF subfamily)
LATLLQARQDKLYRTAFFYLHNQADALDVVQEVALQTMLSIHKLKHPAYFDTWLVRIALNCTFKQMRKLPAIPPTPSSQDPTSASDLHQDLQRDLAQLPRRYQEVIVLYYLHDRPLAEISAVLHLPLGTVKSRLNRGLALLRQKGAVAHGYQLGK